ncbi:MAG: aldose epimerase family protein, partial [Bacillota bacterium]|nr:aldose epimerase family protein [Bacillota bacterium]
LIGRNSNRIEAAEFELNGKKYTLAKNNGRNNLHGGLEGFNKKVWDSKSIDKKEPSLILTLVSHDGDEGFPGKVKVRVTYTLTKNNSIKIHYEGRSDKDTVLNMTNHSYFNLNGHNSGTAENHTIIMDADFYTPNTEECMPYGEILKVDNTPFDFRGGMTLKEGFESGAPQIKLFGGYDHNLVLSGRGFRKVCEAKGDISGIVMDTYTDLPGVQLYTGNFIKEDRVCKLGTTYKKHDAFCLETQVFPNAMKYSQFPSPILKKGDKYDTTTEYVFN